jgi:hypothetical protein
MQRYILILLVIMVTGGLWWWFKPPNHEKILRERIAEIVSIMEREGEENLVVGTLRVNHLKDYLAPEVSVELAGAPVRLSMSKEEVVARAALLRGRYNQIRGSIDIQNVIVMEGGREAWMDVTGSVWLTQPGKETSYAALYRLYWVRPEKEWLLVSSEILLDRTPSASSKEAPLENTELVR